LRIERGKEGEKLYLEGGRGRIVIVHDKKHGLGKVLLFTEKGEKGIPSKVA